MDEECFRENLRFVQAMLNHMSMSTVKAIEADLQKSYEATKDMAARVLLVTVKEHRNRYEIGLDVAASMIKQAEKVNH